MPYHRQPFQRPRGMSAEEYISKLEMEVNTWKQAFELNTEQSRQNLAEISDTLERLHESEEQQRLILKNANDAIITLDEQGRISSWNLAAEHISGYRHDEVLGKYFFDFLIPEKKRDSTKEHWANTVLQWQRKQHGTIIEYPLLHHDGHLVPCEISISANRYRHGISILAVIRDISEHLELINKLNLSKEELEQRVDERTKELRITNQALRQSQKMDAINQLTGGIAHDFNNILNIILGNVELLKPKLSEDEKLTHRIKSIDKAAKRAADLTKQLLGVSRKHTDNISSVNLNQIIQEMEQLVFHSLTPQVELQTYFDETLSNVMINADDFRDTLINLVINARDAMEGRGRLILKTSNTILDENYCKSHPTVKPGEYVQLSIGDTGSGISEDKLERIFEPFYTTKPQGKGTGLGLSMVFGFCNRSRGHITVDSELDIGTTFTINIPKARTSTTENTFTEVTKERPAKGNEKILVVDDELDLLELTQESLQQLGYQVHTASNANSALELLNQHPDIDVLFSDIVMPGNIDGYELKKQVALTYPHIKVLLTSGYAGKATSETVPYSAAILRKPYTQHELASKIRELLDSETQAQKTSRM